LMCPPPLPLLPPLAIGLAEPGCRCNAGSFDNGKGAGRQGDVAEAADEPVLGEMPPAAEEEVAAAAITLLAWALLQSNNGAPAATSIPPTVARPLPTVC
jgi:hypothetical protein